MMVVMVVAAVMVVVVVVVMIMIDKDCGCVDGESSNGFQDS